MTLMLAVVVMVVVVVAVAMAVAVVVKGHGLPEAALGTKASGRSHRAAEIGLPTTGTGTMTGIDTATVAVTVTVVAVTTKMVTREIGVQRKGVMLVFEQTPVAHGRTTTVLRR